MHPPIEPSTEPPPACRWPAFAVSRLPPPPAPGEVQLWLASLDDPPLPSLQLQALLDDGERDRAARFHFDIHRRRFVHGRGLLRCLLGHALGMPPAQVRFELGAQGKPALARPGAAGAPAARLDFNLSHSGALMLLGLSDGAAIGVDIEVPREVPELQAIAEHNFAPAEYRELMALAPASRADAFFATWTRKEAFVKALGGGLSVPLDGFEVTVQPGAPARLRRSADPAHPVGDFLLWADRTPQGCWCAAIVRSPAAIVRTLSLL